MEFEFHPGRSARCLADRGFDFEHAALVFDGDVIEFEDTRLDYGEVRMTAIGPIDGDLYKVV